MSPAAAQASPAAGPLVPDDHLDRVIDRCLHCGLCLPVCPTYAVTQNESSSPRGRIRLFRSVRDGSLEPDRMFAEEMHFCLDCQACQTACPAGVRYGEIVEEARSLIKQRGLGPAGMRFVSYLLLNVIWRSRKRFLMFAGLLRLLVRSGLPDALERSGLLSILPWRIGRAVALLPRSNERPFDVDPPVHIAGGGESVGLLAGCIMNTSFQDVLADIAYVLRRNGFSVVVPSDVFCCGSLHAHNGDPATGARLAGETLASFPDRLRTIVVPAAGCSAHLKKFAPDRIEDSVEFMARRGFEPPGGYPCTATYHEACHLVHGQNISAGPRSLIGSIRGVDFRELPEAAWCCGSAGIYNVLRPSDARIFGDRKAASIASTGAEMVLTSNPGCHLQIKAALAANGVDAVVMHPLSLLRRAYETGS